MVAHNLIVMTLALVLDALIGDPAWFYLRVAHPVVWMGRTLSRLDRLLNRPGLPPPMAMTAGGLSLAFYLFLFGAPAWLAHHYLSHLTYGWVLEALLSSTLLAQRSLYDHVGAVVLPLERADIGEARMMLGRIVGRDVDALDNSGICRAAIESLAENLSDGVVAPLFWGCLLGLPGIVVYKAINTADSMIGHRTPAYLYFGRAAARLDDIVNLIPARLTGLLIALAALSRSGLRAMWKDARKHRSPNAGWPEAAMAGALAIRLSGPRAYHGTLTPEPWVNESGQLPDSRDVRRALALMVRVCAILLIVIGATYLIVSGNPATTSSTWFATEATS